MFTKASCKNTLCISQCPHCYNRITPWGFQVFLYSRAMHCFDQPIGTTPSFILGNMIGLKGGFGSRFSTFGEWAHSFLLLSIHAELLIWWCVNKSHWQPLFFLIYINTESTYQRGGKKWKNEKKNLNLLLTNCCLVKFFFLLLLFVTVVR